jgi:hypothetical protein
MKTTLHIAALGGILSAFSAGTTDAQLVSVTNRFTISIVNPTQTQLSGRSFDYYFWSVSELRANYTAAASHCSQVRMRFYVDGVERAVSGLLSASQATGFVDLGPVTPGAHVLTLRAEGVVGGCNTGRLVSWGGSVDVVRAARACDFEWLDIGRSGTNVVISWPKLPCNFLLEATTNQPPVGGWSLVPASPVLVGDRLTVTNRFARTDTFYRLRLE